MDEPENPVPYSRFLRAPGGGVRDAPYGIETMSGTAAARIRDLLFRSGMLSAVHCLWPSRLSVLAYHRIADPDAPGFDTFKPNVSATPDGFAEQMDFVRRHFSVISVRQLVDWLGGIGELPPRPLLITFDDGYRDNFDAAFPILREYGFPAVIYLATDCIGSSTPFYWDAAAYCFVNSERVEAHLPLIGDRMIGNRQARESTMNEWVVRAKGLPSDEIPAAVDDLFAALGVERRPTPFTNLHLDWDHVRQMAKSGVAFGAHTRSHAILSRISIDRAREEIAQSRAIIEAALGEPVRTFAYPNGLVGDFGREHEAILKELGFQAAFTLSEGPQRRRSARRHPFAIRRICISHKDDLARFAAKLSGVARLIAALKGA